MIGEESWIQFNLFSRSQMHVQQHVSQIMKYSFVKESSR